VGKPTAARPSRSARRKAMKRRLKRQGAQPYKKARNGSAVPGPQLEQHRSRTGLTIKGGPPRCAAESHH
jgi:hypothetical protein